MCSASLPYIQMKYFSVPITKLNFLENSVEFSDYWLWLDCTIQTILHMEGRGGSWEDHTGHHLPVSISLCSLKKPAFHFSLKLCKCVKRKSTWKVLFVFKLRGMYECIKNSGLEYYSLWQKLQYHFGSRAKTIIFQKRQGLNCRVSATKISGLKITQNDRRHMLFVY